MRAAPSSLWPLLALLLPSCSNQNAVVDRDRAAVPGPDRFVRFEENRGQTAGEVDYLARLSGATAFLTGGDAVFVVRGAEPSGAAVLRLSFVGGSGPLEADGEGELPSRSHYLVGRDSAGWHTDVRHVERVRYRDLYPGIDLLYRGGGAGLEFDLVARPGADPSPIRFRMSGAESLALRGGRLDAHVGTGRVTLEPPRVYQEIEGERRPVPGRFRLGRDAEVRFELGAYDRSLPLTIDPLVVVYSSYVGGSGGETATDLAVDGQGMMYVTGQTFSTDFPVAGAVQAAPASGEDAYVLKVNPAASGAASLVYATYLGSTDRDGAEGIAVDTMGRAFVTGWTHAGDFPVTTNGFKPTFTPNPSPNDDESDAFIVVLNPAGNGLAYGTFFGGDRDEEGMGIVPLANDVLAVAGGTDGGSFPTTSSAFDRTGQVRSVFVSFLNWSTNTLVYSTVYHAAPNVQLQARGFAVDASGRAHVTGLVGGQGLPVVNAFMATRPPDATGSFGLFGSFLAVFDPAQSGTASLVYATHLGAGDAEDVAVDSRGRSVVVGSTRSPTFPTTSGALQTTCADLILNGSNLGCQRDAFVMLLDPAASGSASLVRATRLGGVRAEDGHGVAVDGSDNVLVTGSTSSAGFPAVLPLTGTSQRPEGETDAFVAKLPPTLGSLDFSTRLGGVTGPGGAAGASDVGRAVAVAPDGGACVAGTTGATDFPTTRAFDATLGGSRDAFVTKLGLASCDGGEATPERPGPSIPFVWEPPLEICLQWPGTPGAPGTFPQRCPPPECPRCGPGLVRGASPGPMPPALARLYAAGAATLAGGGAPRPRARRAPDAALARAVQAAPEGTYFTGEMKKALLSALEPGGAARPTATRLRRQLTEVLNAMELDWRTGGARAAGGADQRPRAGGFGTARRLRGGGDVDLELRPGWPAIPRGVQATWPLVTYRATAAEGGRRDSVEVSIYAGWTSFTEGGELRMLAWNGRGFRDVTASIDPLSGVITGRMELGNLVVIGRFPPCLTLNVVSP